MNVIQHLRNLLMQHDAVILPGFGEFTTLDTPASAKSSGEFAPPAKVLAFNPSIKANDYVLAKYIAEKEEVSISTGNEMIKKFVDEITYSLQQDHTVTIPLIGTFSIASADAPWSFVPDSSSNLQTSSFGLESFQVPLSKQSSNQIITEQPVAETVERIPHQETSVNQKPKRKRLWIWLIVLTLILMAAITLVMLYPDEAQEYKTLLLQKITSTEKPTDLPEPTTENLGSAELVPAIDTPNTTMIPDPEANEQNDHSTNHTMTSEPVQAISASNQVVIIAGCFGEKTNAERMADRLKQMGFSEASLDGKTASGLFRVAAGYYPSHEAATNALRKAEEENKLKNAWIGKRMQP